MQISATPELLARARRLPAVAAALERLEDAPGQRVALVGGAVRDLLLGSIPLDIDLVIEGPIEPVVQALGGDARAYDRFGTASIDLAGRRVDLAAARSERYEAPGALPSVAPAPLEADLERRDFTVNALALLLAGPSPGELLAVENALDDVAQRRLRVLHARSFVDDPTRLLRLARYAGRLGFEIEQETLTLAGAALGEGALQTVSGARIGNELRLLAREPDPITALAMLRQLGIDRAIDPQLGLTDDEWAARALELLRGDGRPDLLILALAMRRQAPARARQMLDQLAFPAEEREAIVRSAELAEGLSASLAAASLPSEIAAAAAGAPPQAVALAGALGPARQARRWLGELRHVAPAIDGNDLLAAGIPAGPAIGAGLAAARAVALDGIRDDRDAQLGAALDAARRALGSGP